MRTLSNGILVPEDDDAGNVWSDAIENDLEAVNDLISQVNNLTISDISRQTTDIDKANWAVDADGKGYKQIVSMPTGLTLEIVKPVFRVTSGPKIYRFIEPSIQPLSATSFEVVVNDNSLDLQILYI